MVNVQLYIVMVEQMDWHQLTVMIKIGEPSVDAVNIILYEYEFIFSIKRRLTPMKPIVITLLSYINKSNCKKSVINFHLF